MAQRNIDFGTFPDDPDADAIRTAFQKTQENFTELFAGISDQGVLSVNKTPGAGITVSPITGNVVVNANIACVTIRSSTLDISLSTGAPGNAATMINSTNEFFNINLPSNITGVNNANFAGTVAASTVVANSSITSSNSISAIGNISGGNFTTTGSLVVGGNATAGNLSANNITGTTLVGTLATATQPNITGVGTLTSLSVSGNANVGNIGATYFIGNGYYLTDVVAAPGNIVLNADTNISIPSPNSSIFMSVAGTTNVVIINQTGINVAGYLTSTGMLTSGNANLGNAAQANYFVGTLYGTANSAITASSATTAGTVTTASQPNITSVGTLSSLTVTGKVTAGQLQGEGGNISNVQGANVSGTVANATYATNAGSATLATSATTADTVTTAAQPNITSVGTLTSVVVTGNVAAGNVSGGNLVSANYLTGTLTTAAQPNITSVGTLSSLTVTGKVTAGQLQGDGGNISNIQGANVSGAVAYATTANSVAGANISGQVANALVAGTVYTNAQPNITSVGTLTGLAVSGNITAANVSVTSGILSGNGSGLTNLAGANVTGTVANAMYATTAGSATTANTAATVTTNAQPNITSVGALSSLSVVGNLSSGNANLGNLVTANYFSGDGSLLTNISVGAGSYIVNGNSEVRIDANSNVRITVGGTANVLTVSNSGATVIGNLSANNINATLVGGTITTASQPNITSLGTLTALDVNGIATLGAIGNIKISGGSNNQVLVATGTGSNLAFITATSLTTAPGANTQVLFNDAGSFQANANLTFNKTTGTLSSQALSVTANGTFGNVYANSGTVRGSLLTGTLTTNAQPNITSVGTLTALTVTGNINAGNIQGGNLLTGNFLAGTLITAAQPNITSVGTLGSLTVTNKVTAGQLQGDGGNISNIQGANVSGAVATATSATTATTATSATTAATVTTAAQPNITSVGTLTGLTVNGNTTVGRAIVNPGIVTTNVHAFTVLQTWNNANTQFSAIEANITDTASAANSLLIDLQISNVSKFAVSKEGNVFYSGVITGNGSGLSAIAGANVTGTVATATTAGTVTTNAQPNITSVGTLITLNVNNTVTAVSFTANTGVFTGNGSALTTLNASNISSGTLAQARLANSSLTINGISISLGGSATITANTTQTLTLGSYLTGTSFNGGTAVTATVDATTTSTASKIVARDANANIYANNAVFTTVSGNGSGLSAIAGANVTGTVANATYATSAGSATTATSATTAGTVTTNAQPNITSTGTLTSLTVSGNISAQANVNMNGFVIRSVATGIAASGSTQATATAIAKEMNLVTTVTSGTGVLLPPAVAGMAITIINTSANSLLVYPHVGGNINGAAANTAFTQPSGATLQFVTPNTTDWYTVGATFA